jgi:hypothetical protein
MTDSQIQQLDQEAGFTFNPTRVSLLLYLETRAVDHRGRVSLRHMNEEDLEIAREWDERGFLSFGRIRHADITEDGTHAVHLSEAAWALAHHYRKAKAERVYAKRDYRTTAEKRADKE